ncbi:MAG: TA system VapC family ribonuclease toxin [Verrucomicrobiota bacterium]
MILPDINLLLYAYNKQAPQYERASMWWEEVLNGRELVGMPHEVSLGFLRIATNPRMGQLAIPFEAARQVVTTWLAAPNVRVLLPRTDHAVKVLELMQRAAGSGQLASDASLAVYAIENRATLCSNDSDFVRFAGLDWKNPLL